ncbi:MAG: hypothetical protein PWQ48_91 [Thermotogaceae bacterium]|nr:hypothetical protein [Thermotogaceae bacterium]
MTKKIKLFILVLSLFAFFVISCQMNLPVDVNNGKESDKPVIGFGTTEDVDYIEGRLVIGYEDKDAALEIVQMFDGTVLKDLEKIKALSFKFDGKVEDALNILRKTKLEGIRYIEPSYIRQIEPPQPVDDSIIKSITTLPSEKQISEEYWKYLWGLKAVNAELAWTTATGSGVVVAVVDTGVDGTHPDLQGQLVEGYRPSTGETLPATSDSSFGGAHGTHVAGTIAAKRDGNGVMGLAYNAKIMPIVIFDNGGSYVGDDYVADGVIWAVDNGADVLSNSWGGWGYSYVLKDAYDYAIDHGAIVVFSAGNDHTDQHVQAPVGYPGIIGVAAVEYNGGNYRTTFFSNRGDYVSVGAPGVAILSTVPLWDTEEFFDGENPYAFYQGTSMACPHVSALAALIKERYPDANQWEVRKILEQTALDIDDPGYDHSSGYGLINAKSALSLSPAGVANTGASLDVVAVDSWGNPLQAVFVALHRKAGDGGNYYAKTDLSGVAHFPAVDTGEYDIIVGGPDSFDGSYYDGYAGISYVYRQEEERQYTRTINLSTDSTETFYFESTFLVDLVSSPTINATVLFNDALYELSTGSQFNYYTLSFTGNNSYDFSDVAGYCYLAITRDSTGATVTIDGTATINGYQIPIFGQLDKDATFAIIDDTGGTLGINLWWSLFGQLFTIPVQTY